MRDRFIDPATGDHYDFHINHEAEEPVGRTRSIQHSANTANVGLVRTQGEKTPLVMRWTGTILHLAQLQAMWDYFERCDYRTIHVRDAFGDEYEVQITRFDPVRVRVAKNAKDAANAPLNKWTYTLEMEVFTVISGSIAGIVGA
jgi:hypothetical protein